MDQELLQKLDAHEQKLDRIQRSVEQMRRYFLWPLIITVAVIVLPPLGRLILLLTSVRT